MEFFIRNRCVYMSLDKCVACDRHLDVSQLQLSFITAINFDSQSVGHVGPPLENCEVGSRALKELEHNEVDLE